MILRLHEVARSHGAGRQRYRLPVPAKSDHSHVVLCATELDV
ncbi:hypothetical protein NB836_033045, partial [Pseudomonas aeruginosa]|nr:hypothetical protein [Pseudomonas aeruginosa]